MVEVPTGPRTLPEPCRATDVECFAESSGSLQIDSIVGGVPLSNSSANAYYEYQWSIDTTQWLIFDTTSSSINNLSAGIYQLIIKDSLCEDTTDFIIFQNSNLNLDSTITIPFCFGDSSGSIDINLTGGTPPYTLLWTGPNGFTSNDTSISNLMADTIETEYGTFIFYPYSRSSEYYGAEFK